MRPNQCAQQRTPARAYHHQQLAELVHVQHGAGASAGPCARSACSVFWPWWRWRKPLQDAWTALRMALAHHPTALRGTRRRLFEFSSSTSSICSLWAATSGCLASSAAYSPAASRFRSSSGRTRRWRSDRRRQRSSRPCSGSLAATARSGSAATCGNCLHRPFMRTRARRSSPGCLRRAGTMRSSSSSGSGTTHGPT